MAVVGVARYHRLILLRDTVRVGWEALMVSACGQLKLFAREYIFRSSQAAIVPVT